MNRDPNAYQLGKALPDSAWRAAQMALGDGPKSMNVVDRLERVRYAMTQEQQSEAADIILMLLTNMASARA
jgi:hypothetical protein